MIGLWASTRTHTYSVTSSSDGADCGQSILKRHFSYGNNQSIIDHIKTTRILDNATWRPIHDLVVHTEATRVAQLCYIVTRLGCPPKNINCVKTDAIIMSVPARKLAAVKGVAKIQSNHLHTLRQDYERVDPNQTFLNAHSEMSPLTSSDLVYRYSDKGIPLQGNYSKPHRDVAPPTPLPPWRDLTEDEACTTVMSGQSLLVQGSPGSGKSFFVRELVRAFT